MDIPQCLSIHQLKDIWDGTLEMKLQINFHIQVLSEHKFSFLLNKYVGVVLVGLMLSIRQLYSKEVLSACISIVTNERYSCSHSTVSSTVLGTVGCFCLFQFYPY